MKQLITPEEYRKIIEMSLEREIPEPCYICGYDKRFTKLFVEPSVDELVSYFEVLGNSKTFGIAETFWLCEHHYKLLTDYIANDCEDDEFYAALKSCRDQDELKQYKKMLLGIKYRHRRVLFLCLINHIRLIFKMIVEKLSSKSSNKKAIS